MPVAFIPGVICGSNGRLQSLTMIMLIKCFLKPDSNVL